MTASSASLDPLGVADPPARRGYARRGIHRPAARPGFSAPMAAVNGGRIRVWPLADIEAFEQGRPEPVVGGAMLLGSGGAP